MALSIGIKKGSRIKIGGEPVKALVRGQQQIVKIEGGTHLLTVDEIRSMDEIHVTVNGKQFVITNLQRTEVAPRVFVSAGRDDGKGAHATSAGYTRLAFDAPRTININRVPNGDA